jgi:1-acyl-sn-glycerol-3-phosphate acyltransferase
LYRFSRFVVSLGMRGYFRSIEVSGRHHVPARGPVILASNHPHSITDALVLGYGAGRMLHFLAHSGLFTARWQAWFLRNSGVIPIYRPRDVATASEANLAMFAACHQVLVQGGAIGIFPEGTSAEERRVQKLKTGTARIALGAEDGAGWDLGVQIIPVGLNFESSIRFRSRVLIRCGPPLRALDFRDRYAADPVAAGAALTDALQTALRHQVVHVEEAGSEQLIRDIEEIYRAELLARPDVDIPGGTPFQRGQTISREFGRALGYFQTANPEAVWGLSRRLRRYHTLCKVLKVRDSLLRDERGPVLRTELARFAGLGLLGLPWAVVGLLGNYPPYRLTGWVARHLVPDRTKTHLAQFVLGCLFFAPWYIWVWRLARTPYGQLWATLLVLALPPAGLFARRFFRYLARRRQMIRLAWLELVHGLRIADMRRRRRALIRELDAAMADYLAARKEAP